MAECVCSIASQLNKQKEYYLLMTLSQCGVYDDTETSLWVDVNNEECIVFDKSAETRIARHIVGTGVTIGQWVVCFSSDPGVTRLIKAAQRSLGIV